MAADATVDVREAAFRAMGSDAHVVLVGRQEDRVAHPLDDLLVRARQRIDALERRWSRFLPDSETSWLGRRAGWPVTVSADTALLVRRAVEAWRVTGGSFDPTVLGALVAAGYDRTFEALGDPAPPLDNDRLDAVVVGCTDIVVEGRTVTLPAGSGFDPGGIGKGLAADLVAEELIVSGAAGACVNLGGDLRVVGLAPRGEGWTIAVEHPWLPQPLALAGLREGAVATSTTLRRRWARDGRLRHHLIDPATGEPSTSDLRFATVITDQAWRAEAMATACLLRGSDRAFDLLDATFEALVVDRRGTVRTTPGFSRFLGDSAPPTTMPLDLEVLT